MTISEELKLEGHAREIIRHLQTLRKEANFELSERIHSYVISDDEEIRLAVKKHHDLIAQETLSVEIFQEGIDAALECREVQLDDLFFQVGVKITSLS